jgi:hypothetical protein
MRCVLAFWFNLKARENSGRCDALSPWRRRWAVGDQLGKSFATLETTVHATGTAPAVIGPTVTGKK